jgi:hypothetical protein
MGLLRYYSLLVRTAFTHTLSVAQHVLFVFMLIVGAAIWFAPNFYMTIALTSPPDGWTVAAVTFGLIIGIRLLLAPYWIWKTEREARLRTEIKLRNATIRLPRPLAYEIVYRLTARRPMITHYGCPIIGVPSCSQSR